MRPQVYIEIYIPSVYIVKYTLHFKDYPTYHTSTYLYTYYIDVPVCLYIHHICQRDARAQIAEVNVRADRSRKRQQQQPPLSRSFVLFCVCVFCVQFEVFPSIVVVFNGRSTSRWMELIVSRVCVHELWRQLLHDF
jgi:hypothetical protein